MGGRGESLLCREGLGLCVINSIKGRNKMTSPRQWQNHSLSSEGFALCVCFLFRSCGCREDIEQQLGSLILATDINRQNEFLTQLKTHLQNKDLRLEDESDRHFVLQVNDSNKAAVRAG